MAGYVRQLAILIEVKRGDTSGIDNLNKKINDLGNSSNKVARSANSLARTYAINVGIPAGIALGLALRSAVRFESKMTDVQKVVDGLDTKEKLNEFAKSIEEMSKTIPITRDGLAEMAMAAGQSGIKLSEMDSFISLAAKTMIAFDMDSRETGRALALLKSNLNLSIPAMKEFIGQINIMGDSTNAVEKDIVEVLLRIASTGQSLGLAKEEVLGLTTAMLNLGVAPERASTAMDNLMSTAKMQQKSGESLIQTVMRLFKALDNIGNEQQRLLTMQKLFGKGLEAMNIDKARNYFKGLREGGKGTVDVFKLLGDSAGKAGNALDVQFARKLDTASSQIQLFKNNMEVAMGQLGTSALPTLVSLAKYTAKIFDAFSKLPKPVKEFAVALLAIGVVIGPVLKIVGALSALTKLSIISNSIKLLAKNPIMGAALLAGLGYGVNKAFNGEEEGNKQDDIVYDSPTESMSQSRPSYASQSLASNQRSYTPMSNSTTNNNGKQISITNQYNNTFSGDKSGYQDFFKLLEQNNAKQSTIIHSLL